MKIRRKLEDFTCFDLTSHCWDGCNGFDDCEIGEAYREYLKLAKCARLLGIFLRWKDAMIYKQRLRGWEKWQPIALRQSRRLHRYIRSALNKAGL